MRRLIRLAANIFKSNFGLMHEPFRCTYIVTYKCNFRCAFCNIWKKSGREELSLNEIERFFKKSNQFSWINLSGGEIFLRPDIFDIIKIIDMHCRNIYVLDFPTTGYDTDTVVTTVKKILNECSFPKLFVTVSLDGTLDIHDGLRGVPGAWRRAVETFRELRMLRSKRFSVYFGVTLQAKNIAVFDDMVYAVNHEIGHVTYDDFHINLQHSSVHYYGTGKDDPAFDADVVWRQVKSITAKRRKPLFSPVAFLERRYLRLIKDYLFKKHMPIPCQALAVSFFMNPAGDVYPCSIYNRCIGNIKEYAYTISLLWQATMRHKTRADICRGACPGCWTPCEAYQSILAKLLPVPRRTHI